MQYNVEILLTALQDLSTKFQFTGQIKSILRE